ncbi:hypothetical protein ECEC4203_0642, partial [Escherichia coli EC4203]
MADRVAQHQALVGTFVS